MEFSIKLSRTVAKYKVLGLPKNTRDVFPEKGQLFDVKFKGKTYKLKISGETKDILMLTPLYDAHEFEKGETLTIKSAKNGFDFSVE